MRNASILVCAVLLGAILGPMALPLEFTRQVHLEFQFGLHYPIVGLLALVFIVVALDFLNHLLSGEKQLDQDLLDAFLEHIPDNVYFKDRDSRFVRISRSMAKYFGLENPGEALNKLDADIFSGEHAEQALRDEQEIMKTGLPLVNKEEKETWPDGRETWALTTKLPLRDREGRIIGTMGISHNITEQKLAEYRLRHMAVHDAVTGLPNRLLLEDRLIQAIAAAKRSKQVLAVFLLNLDRFKSVNDSFGHRAGDRVLESIGHRLKRVIRTSDTVARLGGDEFVLACSGLSNTEEIEGIANSVQALFSKPFLVDGNEVQVMPSIGIAQFPTDGNDPEELLQGAESAMHEAKKKGRGHISFYSPALTFAMRRENQLETDLIHALARDQFEINYQPFVSSESGQITGMEALLRWRHPKQGLIPPDRFIPQLEKLGMMNDVGGWVLREACRQAKEWREIVPHLRIAVNVSSQQFSDGNLVNAVEIALRESQLDAQSLELELTESRMLDDSASTLSVLRRLKQIGVSLSLDDFGTGWSSLSYLRHFPFDRLKIDRSFVRDLASQPSARAMVKSILALSQILDLSTIAEGVETSEQRDMLSALNCPEMQGFYFSRPLPDADATALLRSQHLPIRTLENKVHPRCEDAFPNRAYWVQ